MNLETFFEKFEQFAGMPDAVGKMRELVLSWAVQGRLIPFKEANEKQTIGDHLDFQNGYAFKSEWFKPDGVRLCRNANVSHGALDWRMSKFVSKEIAEEFKRFTLKEGDVILSLDRPLIATGLKVARVRKADLPCLLLQRVAKPIPKHDQIDMEYFFMWLHSSEFVSSIDPGRSNGVPHISTRQIQRLAFSLPPLAKQKRIVAKVDELMALCDRLEAQQQERETRHTALARASLARFAEAPTPSNLGFLFHKSYDISPADLRKSILSLAVQGKLVPQDPSEGTAKELLQRLCEMKENLVRAEGIRRRPPIPVTSYSENPPGVLHQWELTAFGQVLVIVSGVTKGRKLSGKATLQLPYLRVANVQRGHTNLEVIKTIEVLEDDLKRYRLEFGDVLMTEGGDWDKVGRAAIWREEIEDCIHQNHVYRVRSPSKSELLPEWITLYVNSPYCRAYFENASKQTTNLASINLTQLRACPLPIPPSEEQTRIVTKVDQLMALVDQLEAQLTESRTTAANLMEAIVAEIAA